MKKYIGTKIISAEPQNMNGVDGYAVVYDNGYQSWSPKDAFEAAYKEIKGPLSFSHALEFVKMGALVAREGWNGKGMFVFLVNGSTFAVNRPPLEGIFPKGTEVNYLPHIDMKTADGSIVPWLASQTDILADDWLIVGGGGQQYTD